MAGKYVVGIVDFGGPDVDHRAVVVVVASGPEIDVGRARRSAEEFADELMLKAAWRSAVEDGWTIGTAYHYRYAWLPRSGACAPHRMGTSSTIDAPHLGTSDKTYYSRRREMFIALTGVIITVARLT